MFLDVGVNPDMPQTESKAILEGNGPIPQDKSELGGLTMKKIRRIFAEELDKYFDRMASHFDQRLENTEKNNKNNQRLVVRVLNLHPDKKS